jgi:hydrogenase-4 component H
MRTPKLRELKEAITSLVRRPYTLNYPKAPSIPPATFRGKPLYNDKECIGCAACFHVCPAEAIEMKETVNGNSGKRKFILHYDHCVFCGQCHRYCTTDIGVVLTNEYDMATYDRTEAKTEFEKDLLICEHCGTVIGTVDHIRWVARRLGAKVYTNMGLALSLYKDLSRFPEPASGAEVPLTRSDRLRFLCPKCRRELVLLEQKHP